MDLNKVVQGLTSSGALSGFAGGLAGSALVGAVSGKKGKKMAKGALKVGALAAVGGLAYTAYQRYRQDAPVTQASTGGQGAAALDGGDGRWQGISEQRFEAAVENEQGNDALLLIRAMIAAASADGHLDRDEQDRVFDEAQKLDLSSREKAMLFDEMRKPLSLPEIVEQVTKPEVAVEVYAASLIAVDESHHDARAWLSSLALALELPRELVSSIHAEVSAARPRHEAA